MRPAGKLKTIALAVARRLGWLVSAADATAGSIQAQHFISEPGVTASADILPFRRPARKRR